MSLKLVRSWNPNTGMRDGRVMSAYEYSIFDAKFDSQGNPICLSCHVLIEDKRRRTYCSDRCRATYTEIHYWDWYRVKKTVFERDKWICQSCGCKVQNHYFYSGMEYQTSHKWVQGFRDDIAECDHIIPLHLGGKDWYEDLSELNNFQTLCRRCHKIKSAKENTNRGKQRREKKGINNPYATSIHMVDRIINQKSLEEFAVISN